MSVESIFKALGDPVRLEIVTRLSDGSTYTIGKLSEDLGVSRQGARKQIQALASADVIQLHPAGRETQVTLNSASLQEARLFITQLERQWDQRLLALKQMMEK
ncbi:ArsR/SmtB family transcription factor [Granulosicoccus antarcticus]|uniref:HTH-type transcriptional regulator n=1 Tax=Granulosicoccus antarcticus IMCC3135 TaxID=1192854 RepID=A0A2Z2NX31_9GAMM|nr:winged helix-turn-helix domain-containing protein [Granulosicoccus antarcticus]ASJ74308.1 HTH-type transcriptional regulator [Granulosicoccus antarcticus IMCC3135]